MMPHPGFGKTLQACAISLALSDETTLQPYSIHMRIPSLCASAAGLACALSFSAAAQVDARMLRQPTVSATQIAFVYGGDIWIMPKTGGTAERLTTARGEESFPKFSPDGKTIAFTADYDGNDEAYTIPATGGEATRLTYHPGDGSCRRLVSRRPVAAHRVEPRERDEPLQQAVQDLENRRRAGSAAGPVWRVRVVLRLTPRPSPTSPRPSTRGPGSAIAAGGRRTSGPSTSRRTRRRTSRTTRPTMRSPCGRARRSTSCPTAARTSAATSGRTTPRRAASIKSPTSPTST